jgi:hypothetical protein
LDVPGLGRLGVTVMMRTALFPFNRARLRNTTPSPQALFEVLARSFREVWASMEFRLPSLRECEAAHEARAQNPNKSVHVRTYARMDEGPHYQSYSHGYYANESTGIACDNKPYHQNDLQQ